MELTQFKKSLRRYSSKERAESNVRFFKTDKGEYGYGDFFLGITVPNTRKILKEFSGKLELKDAVELLQSKYHEERLAGVILLVSLYKINNEKTPLSPEAIARRRKIILNTYLKNTNRVNSWDLVDVSAPRIVGDYLLIRDRKILYKFAKSKSLWERRIAIISTMMFIKNKEYDDCFKLCEILMNDKEDLMHKACGWALREVGKNCGQKVLNKFLDKHVKNMPRTMLRYSLEKHNEKDRKKYMGLK